MIKKRLLTVIKMFCICFLLHSLHFTDVFASKVKYGSITIYSHFNDDDKTITIKNDSFKVIKIADLIGGKYVNKQQYSSFPMYSTDMNASQSRSLALGLESFIKDNNISFDYESTSNLNGYTRFNNLDQGVYLIVQNKSNELQNKYQTNPTILSVPMRGENGDIYDIYIEPKYSEIGTSNVDKLVDNNTIGSSTGEETNINYYILLFISSLSIICYFMYEKININKKKEECRISEKK